MGWAVRSIPLVLTQSLQKYDLLPFPILEINVYVSYHNTKARCKLNLPKESALLREFGQFGRPSTGVNFINGNRDRNYHK